MAIAAMLMASGVGSPHGEAEYERQERNEQRRKAEREVSDAHTADRKAKAQSKRDRKNARRAS